MHAPTLTGVGDRAHLHTPETGLHTHVQDVEVLELDDLHDVVLVGHSAGGAVARGVAQRCADRLREVVHLDAFVPQPGQSVLDTMTAGRRERFLSMVDEDGRIAQDWDAALDGWTVTVPADRAWVRPRLRPHPLRALSDLLPPDPMPDLPHRFIHCTVKPGQDSFAGFAAAAAADPSWRLDELATGHDAMVTAPAKLAALLAT